MTTARPYPEYVDSRVAWLGEIPREWRTDKVGRVTSMTVGWTPPTGSDAAFFGDNLWANISDLGPRELTDTAKRISDEAVRDSRIRQSPKGSLLYSFKLSVGQVSFAGTDLYTNEAIATFLGSNQLSLRYAYYALPEFLIQNAAENIYGAKILNQERILATRIALPPFSMQLQFADYLDRETAEIDTFIAEQEEFIGLLTERRAASITHAVTRGLDPSAPMKDSGVGWLGEVPEGWRVNRFSRCVRINEGQVDPERQPFSDMILIAPNHVEARTGRSGGFETAAAQGAESGKYLVRSGQVIYSKIRPGLAKVIIAPFDCLCSADMYGLDARHDEELTNEYLRWLMLSQPFIDYAIDQSARVAMPKLNQETLGAAPIWYPRIDEQRDIVDYLNHETAELDATIAEARESIALSKERRAALISAVVTGKIDVRGLA
ncbi:restriction endonuclease subunit S [Microbacterium sp. NPDC089696]|uniref:restriction endonuclease subunit S n=1 Tax=Microbacterium sp. NPDC089696 TaxID=3364199 RepID=UPI0037F69461